MPDLSKDRQLEIASASPQNAMRSTTGLSFEQRGAHTGNSARRPASPAGIPTRTAVVHLGCGRDFGDAELNVAGAGLTGAHAVGAELDA